MRFDPVPEDELNQLIPDGAICDAEITKGEHHISKNSGNEGIKLTVRVWHGDISRLINDYLISSPKTMFRIHQFCKATDLLDLYESGELRPQDCEGRTLKVKVKVEKDASGEYPDQNRIGSYIAETTKSAPQTKRAAAVSSKPPKYESVTHGNEPDDSDIPF